MATIANVLTPDGQPSGTLPGDAAGSEAGVEFLALLTQVTGTEVAADACEPLACPSSPAERATEPVDGADPAAAGDLLALMPAAVPLHAAPATGAAVTGRELVSDGSPSRGARALARDVAVRTQGAAQGALPGSGTGMAQGMAPDRARALLGAGLGGVGPEQALLVSATASTAQWFAPPVSHAMPIPGPAGVPGVPGEPVATGAQALAQAAAVVEELVASGDPDPAAQQDTGDGLGPAGQGPGLTRDVPAAGEYVRTVPGAVGTPAWKNALGAEVCLLVERGIGAATLRVSPEHLGPVEVRIDFSDDSASVWFTASHVDTRAALADALPRLRDMLASVGVNLGEAGVHREAPDGSHRHGTAPPGAGGPPASGVEPRALVTRFDAANGLVDEYA